MIVDSSALVAIVKDEPERERYRSLILSTPTSISAATLLELCIVLDQEDPRMPAALDRALAAMDLRTVAFDARQSSVARRAYQRYGRGSGSPARLNFGDCFAYALAVTSGEPLLFKGEDFTHTDVLPAL